MFLDDPIHGFNPEWTDVVMQILPSLYQGGKVTADDDSVFVYAATFAAVGVQVKRGRIIRSGSGADESNLTVHRSDRSA